MYDRRVTENLSVSYRIVSYRIDTELNSWTTWTACVLVLFRLTYVIKN